MWVVQQASSIDRAPLIAGGAAALFAMVLFPAALGPMKPAAVLLAGAGVAVATVLLLQFVFPEFLGGVSAPAVARQLRSLPPEFYVYRDVRVTLDYNTVRLDFVVVGPSGLFVVETIQQAERHRGSRAGQGGASLSHARREQAAVQVETSSDARAHALARSLARTECCPDRIRHIICVSNFRNAEDRSPVPGAERVPIGELARAIASGEEVLKDLTVAQLNGYLSTMGRSKDLGA